MRRSTAFKRRLRHRTDDVGGEPEGPPLARLFELIRPYAGALAIASVIVLMTSGVTLVAPRLAGHVLDSALIDKNRAQLEILVAGLVALFALRGALRYAQIYLVHSSGTRLHTDLQRRLLEHLLRQTPAFYVQRHTGELISRVTSDVAKVQYGLIDGVPSGVQAGFTFLGTIVALFLIRADLALVTLAIVPPVVVVALLFGRKLTRVAIKTGDATAAATQVASEAMAGISTVQAFTRESLESERHKSKLQGVIDLELQYARIAGSFSGVMQFIGFSSFAIVLWYGGGLVAGGEMTPGELTSFLLYSFSVAGSIGTLGSLYSTLKSMRGAAARVFEILDTEPAIQSPASPRPLPQVGDTVRLEGVEFTYPGGEREPALRGIDVEIPANKTIALVGPSGGGKSTIFALLLRFYDPDRGTIRIDGIDIRNLDIEELRSLFGYVPQDIYLFSGTVAENIAYGRPGATVEAIRDAAKKAGASEFIDELANGFDEVVGERGVRLSMGQRQRIAIARAFLREPKILLLDEATSALDPDSEAVVQRALGELTRSRTTLVIAHRLATARRADSIFVIEDGAVSDRGRHEELFGRSPVYRRYWQLQSQLDGEQSTSPSTIADQRRT